MCVHSDIKVYAACRWYVRFVYVVCIVYVVDAYCLSRLDVGELCMCAAFCGVWCCAVCSNMCVVLVVVCLVSGMCNTTHIHMHIFMCSIKHLYEYY